MKKFIAILFALSVLSSGCKTIPSVENKLVVEVSTDDLNTVGMRSYRSEHVAAKVKGSGRFELIVKY